MEEWSVTPFLRTVGMEEWSVTPFLRTVGMEEWSLATYPPTDRRNGGMVGYSVSKNRRRPLQGRQRGILGKLVVLQYSLALTSIFIIKVNFPPNTVI